MRRWIAIAALCGASFVALGAFGAHGLKGNVPASDLKIFETAVSYHAWHAIALLVVSIWGTVDDGSSAATHANLRWVARLFLIGIVVFSGSLYALVLTDTRWLGAVTPVGGLALIVGWIMLAWTGLQRRA